MRLFIAEKPSLGRVIANGLGGGKSQSGFIQGSGWVVTWCFGHLFEMKMPDEYDAKFKRWKREDLPIIPTTFKLKARKDAAAQIKVIRKLVKDAHHIVNAGDPDREGQLLVDEVLWELNNKKPVQRIWLAALDPKSVAKALANLSANQQHQGLCHAALARSRADWLVGLNLTRGYTIRAGRTVTVGRVQTPTLNLVVQRDLEIEHFKPKDFFTLEAVFKHAHGTYTGTWSAKESVMVQAMGDKAEASFDEEGRCLNQKLPEKILSAIQGQQGTIKHYNAKEKQEAAPLPFSLSDLQSEASKRFGLGAQKTLDIAQALYEKHKATTYPRTDCRYMSEGQFHEVGSTLEAMGTADAQFRPLINKADPTLRGRAFNDNKVTAHTAIIPTDNPNLKLSNLSPLELKLYDLIRKRYLAQFYPPHKYQEVNVLTVVQQEPFRSKAKTTTQPGWTVLLRKPEKKEAQPAGPTLPPGMNRGDSVTTQSGQVIAKQTTPPPRFTEGTLIAAMANIARYVDDARAKKLLRETSGIGTEATRASIIENLKKRGFLLAKGKSLISSGDGREVIRVVAHPLKDPVTTAQWEDAMLDIERGRMPLAKFVEGISGWVTKILHLTDGAEFQFKSPPPTKPQTHRRGSKKSNPPTPKMVAFARKLAKQKGLKRLPNGVASDFQACRDFLDTHVGNKKSGGTHPKQERRPNQSHPQN